jgi:hypothetical protein
MKKVSYCTVCYGRLWQLAFTLKDNLENLKDDEELILIDYGSPDDTMIFVLGTIYFKKYIQENKLKFIKVLDIEEYNCPKSKNIAHRLASGEILVNLDVDNFLLGMRDKIDKAFNQNKKRILHMHLKDKSGSFGRIALTNNNFYKLGGYDEKLFPHSHQDTDLIDRAQSINLEYVLDPLDSYVVANNLYVKNRYLKEDWFEMREKNKKISEDNIINGKFIANQDKGWGACKIIQNYENTIINLDPIFP